MTESEQDAAQEAFIMWISSINPHLSITYDKIWIAAVEWAWQNPPEEEKDGGSGQFGVGA